MTTCEGADGEGNGAEVEAEPEAGADPEAVAWLWAGTMFVKEEPETGRFWNQPDVDGSVNFMRGEYGREIVDRESRDGGSSDGMDGERGISTESSKGAEDPTVID